MELSPRSRAVFSRWHFSTYSQT